MALTCFALSSGLYSALFDFIYLLAIILLTLLRFIGTKATGATVTTVAVSLFLALSGSGLHVLY